MDSKPQHVQEGVGVRHIIENFEKYADPIYKRNALYLTLLNRADLLEEIENYLNSQGFRKLEYYDCGNNAVLFSTPHNQLIRLSINYHNTSPVNHGIAEPLPGYTKQFDTGKLGLVRIDISIYPKIGRDSDKITDEHINFLRIRHARQGSHFWDYHKRNVRLHPDVLRL